MAPVATTIDDAHELAQRTARLAAARADPARSSSAIIAALAAGAGAHLVAGQHLAREILAMRPATRAKRKGRS